jgi:ABC-2 type transport system ATP-binding protein
MIEVKQLTKTYGSFTAVDDISFTVEPGQACGFLGPNGAGKTTTMRVVTGYMPATAGTVTVDGYDIFEDSFEVRRRVGYLPEHPPLYNEMRVVSYLDHVAALKGLPRGEISDARDREIESCGLGKVAHRLCGHLSKGYRQRVGLAQALIHQPSVLVLDEPTIGLDPAQIHQIRDLIREIAKQRTVVLSTHILPEVAQICEKVVIINEGRVTLESTVADLTRDSSLEEEYLRRVGGEAAARGDAKPGAGAESDADA